MGFGLCRERRPSDVRATWQIFGELAIDQAVADRIKWKAPMTPAARAARAIEALDVGCRYDSKSTCVELADRYLAGKDVLEDKGRARSLLGRGCMALGTSSCVRAAKMYEDGVGGAADRVKAAELYDRGCATDEASCAARDRLRAKR